MSRRIDNILLTLGMFGTLPAVPSFARMGVRLRCLVSYHVVLRFHVFAIAHQVRRAKNSLLGWRRDGGDRILGY